MRSALLVAVLFVSCAHSTPKPAEEDERTVCDVDPTLQRIAKPAGNPNCTKASRDAYTSACLSDDFNACYFIGTCVLADALGQSDAVKRQLAEQAGPFFKAACKAGMAEACRMRAGAFAETGVPVKDTCEDLTRASQLGDASAQLSCMGACLL